MKIDPNGLWYHGSDRQFSLLRAGSTVTQWRALAEAFSHRPTRLEYDDRGNIAHNGSAAGCLYAVAEPIVPGVDLHPHPRSAMGENVEFLTARPLKVRLLFSTGRPSPGENDKSEVE